MKQPLNQAASPMMRSHLATFDEFSMVSATIGRKYNAHKHTLQKFNWGGGGIRLEPLQYGIFVLFWGKLGKSNVSEPKNNSDIQIIIKNAFILSSKNTG